MSVLQPDVSSNEYLYFKLLSSSITTLLGDVKSLYFPHSKTPRISNILFLFLSIYLIGSPDQETKEIVHTFFATLGRPLKTPDLRCFLECILQLGNPISLQFPDTIVVQNKPVDVESVMNEMSKVLGILENAEIKEEVFNYIVKVTQNGILGESGTDSCAQICEKLHISCESRNVCQEASVNQWSQLITCDNLLVYQEVDHCTCYTCQSLKGLTPVEEIIYPEPYPITSSLFLHCVFNPDWSLGCLSLVFVCNLVDYRFHLHIWRTIC